MKRLLPAITCALALHAIMLSTDFSWLKLGPRPAPAFKSLSISLSAHQLQERNAQTAAATSEPEKRLPPEAQQARQEKAADTQTPARLAHSAPIRKQSVADTPKSRRQKKNLKALTRKPQPVKAIKATRAESIGNDHVFPAARSKIFSTASSANPSRHDPFPAKKAPIQKTRRMTGENADSTSPAVALTSKQSDNRVSATALTMAKPLYRQNPVPLYPRKARRMGYEGIVMLKVLVDETGRVDDLRVLESSGHSILDRTALASVRKWLFEPGTEGGIKKKMWVRVPVRFRLE